MRVLVVGATGMLGEPVARRLNRDGFTVRVLARNAAKARIRFSDGYDIVGGDVTRPETLPPALEGCDGLHINLRGRDTLESFVAVEQQGAENLAAAASRAGVGRITYLGGAGRADAALNNPMTAIKRAAAAAIRESGVGYTIFKATHFMESLPQFIRGNTATIIGRQPHRYHYLAADDYAGMVSRAFSVPEAANRELTVFGPEPFTMREALEVYRAACLPQLKISTMPIWLFRLIATVRGDQSMKFVATLFAAFEQLGESGNPEEANELLGTPRTTLAQWCAQQARAGGPVT